MCYYMEQTPHWMKTTKSWEQNSIYISQFLFRFFEDYAINTEIDLGLLPFILGEPK